MIYSAVFFDFLQYCIGASSSVPSSLKSVDWHAMYAMAKKQALVGVLFHGIQKLPRELAPEPELLTQWIGQAQMIRQRNMVMNRQSAKVYAAIRAKGYRGCILKGQGNALMYPDAYVRTSGDVDVWMMEDRDKVRKMALALSDSGHLDGREIYKHVEVMMDGVSVKLHPVPATLNNPVYDSRLRKWFERNGDLQCSNIVRLPDGAGEIAVPTTAFNVIYQLSHLYHHFFDEGIGMRQMIDYYFVVKSLNMDSSDGHGCHAVRDDRLSQMAQIHSDIAVLRRELKHLGLRKFAGAVMYVLHEALGMPEAQMVVPMDEKRGRLLLDEIMQGGDFCKHFSKYGHFAQQGMAKKYFLKIWRNMHFVRYYPAEILSEPVFMTWHFFWRQFKRE